MPSFGSKQKKARLECQVEIADIKQQYTAIQQSQLQDITSQSANTSSQHEDTKNTAPQDITEEKTLSPPAISQELSSNKSPQHLSDTTTQSQHPSSQGETAQSANTSLHSPDNQGELKFSHQYTNSQQVEPVTNTEIPPEALPEVPPGDIPSEDIPLVTSEDIPLVTSEDIPLVTSEDIPLVTSEDIPLVTSEDIPLVSPKGSPQAQGDSVPQAIPECQNSEDAHPESSPKALPNSEQPPLVPTSSQTCRDMDQGSAQTRDSLQPGGKQLAGAQQREDMAALPVAQTEPHNSR